jgi:hypothetical protein
VLDFASGYGCVTRHMRTVLPRAAKVACDIHPAAVKFIRNQLGTPAILSAHSPDALSVAQKFEAIFALSFFSHMPDSTWCKWLSALCSLLIPRGILIFTTHGEKSLRYFPPDVTLDENGFYFLHRSEQTDLEPSEYGSMITSRDYVQRQIDEIEVMRVAEYAEASWYGHQDTYVLRREK